MDKEFEVNIDNALRMIDIVQKWGERPEIKKDLAPARVNATNSLMGLIVTGTKAGVFPNIPEFNQLLFDKLAIAFDMGYYAHSSKGESACVESKFQEFNKLLKTEADIVIIDHPEVLGDTYEELVENLRRLGNSGKALLIVLKSPEKSG